MISGGFVRQPKSVPFVSGEIIHLSAGMRSDANNLNPVAAHLTAIQRRESCAAPRRYHSNFVKCLSLRHQSYVVPARRFAASTPGR